MKKIILICLLTIVSIGVKAQNQINLLTDSIVSVVKSDNGSIYKLELTVYQDSIYYENPNDSTQILGATRIITWTDEFSTRHARKLHIQSLVDIFNNEREAELQNIIDFTTYRQEEIDNLANAKARRNAVTAKKQTFNILLSGE